MKVAACSPSNFPLTPNLQPFYARRHVMAAATCRHARACVCLRTYI